MGISAISPDLEKRIVEAMARELANQEGDTCFDNSKVFPLTNSLRRNSYERRAWKLFHAAYNILREG